MRCPICDEEIWVAPIQPNGEAMFCHLCDVHNLPRACVEEDLGKVNALMVTRPDWDVWHCAICGERLGSPPMLYAAGIVKWAWHVLNLPEIDRQRHVIMAHRSLFP